MNNSTSAEMLTNYPRLLARLAIGLLIGGAGLWWAWRGLDWPVVQQILVRISPAWLTLSILGVVAVTLTKAGRWKALYRLTGSPTSFWNLFSVLVAAQMVNFVIPIRLGELMRISLMKQHSCRATVTLSTLIIEKLVDLVTTGIIAVSLASLALAPTWLHEPASGLFLSSLILTLSLILMGRLRQRITPGLGRLLASRRLWPERWSERLLGVIQLVMESLGTLSQWRLLARVMAWNIAVWLLSWLTMLVLLVAFDLELPLSAAVVLMLAVSMSNIVPAPPALVGVMQGIAVVVLGWYGVTQVVAFAFGLVLNLVVVAPLIILGSVTLYSHLVLLLYLLRQRWLDQSLVG